MKAQKLDVVFQPEAGDQLAAFARVVGAFFFRPGDPGLNVGLLARNDAGGANVGFDVLDRHDAAYQAHDGRNSGRPQCPQRAKAHHVNAVGNVAGAFGARAVLHLAQAIGLIERNDLVTGVVTHAAQRFKKADPHGAKVTCLSRVPLQHGAVVGNPAGGVQINAPLFGVDAVLAEDQTFAVPAFEQCTQKASVAGGHRVVAAHLRKGLDNV